jgi:hypothetical protein
VEFLSPRHGHGSIPTIAMDGQRRTAEHPFESIEGAVLPVHRIAGLTANIVHEVHQLFTRLTGEEFEREGGVTGREIKSSYLSTGCGNPANGADEQPDDESAFHRPAAACEKRKRH